MPNGTSYWRKAVYWGVNGSRQWMKNDIPSSPTMEQSEKVLAKCYGEYLDVNRARENGICMERNTI